ncbi:MAG TPA: response regulator [Methanoregula sp.]|nr:response regulator [Methanoregula sp.]
MLSVLVIDDDAAVLDVTRLMLERSDDITVKPVSSSMEALKILQNDHFDAIVLDYDLPEINGIDFLKIIRSRGDITPVIIFTGVGREQAAIAALNCGATFFLKKGEGTDRPFVELDRMIRLAVDQRFTGKAKSLSCKIVSDLVNFSLDAGFAIDPKGNVIAWNAAIEQLTGEPSQVVIDKGDFVYSRIFFGKRQKMLIDLVFSPDDAIKNSRYMIVSREKNGPVVAVTRAEKADGNEWTLWMKAMPVFDNRGRFIAAVCVIRDVTTTFRDVQVDEEEPATAAPSAKGTSEKEGSASGGIIDWILGRAGVQYREGVRLYITKGNYREAIRAFDRALDIDKNLAYVWNDRGICYRTLGDYDEALKSFVRAAELDPGNVEILYDLGETLEQMGVMQMNKTYLESAIETFRMVINILPNNMDSWHQIGVCLKGLGMTEESKFYLDRARDISLLNKDTPVPRKRDVFL